MKALFWKILFVGLQVSTLILAAKELSDELRFLAEWKIQAEQLHSFQSVFNINSTLSTVRNQRSLLPPRWKEVNDITTYPKDNLSESYLVDIWDYLQRMTLYKTLLQITNNHCLWSSSFDPKLDIAQGNILWGLPLQHGWQYDSGRLFVNDSNMNPKAWWADMNYYLSVIPYLGAMKASLVPSIKITVNPNPTLFCDETMIDKPPCSEIIQPWTKYFLTITNTTNDCSRLSAFERLTVPFTPIADSKNYHLDPFMESTLQLLWTAHIQSIHYASTLFPIEQDPLLSSSEQLFGNAWSLFVDYVATAYFPCNLTVTNWLQNVLPHRLLTENDTFIPTSDLLTVLKLDEESSININVDDDKLSCLEMRAVRFIDGLYWLDNQTNEKVTEIWSNQMMCTEEGRSHGRKLLLFGIYRLEILFEEFNNSLTDYRRTDLTSRECHLRDPCKLKEVMYYSE